MSTTIKTPKITWINTCDPHASRDERGYWQSVEGRFHVSPQYRHTVYPSHYQVTDYMAKQVAVPGLPSSAYVSEKRSFDTIIECKVWAQTRLPDSDKR